MIFKISYAVTFDKGLVNPFYFNGPSTKGNPIRDFCFREAISKEDAEKMFYDEFRNSDDRTYSLIKIELS